MKTKLKQNKSMKNSDYWDAHYQVKKYIEDMKDE